MTNNQTTDTTWVCYLGTVNFGDRLHFRASAVGEAFAAWRTNTLTMGVGSFRVRGNRILRVPTTSLAVPSYPVPTGESYTRGRMACSPRT